MPDFEFGGMQEIIRAYGLWALFGLVILECMGIPVPAERGGPGCLNRFSASISGASARVRLPSGEAAA